MLAENSVKGSKSFFFYIVLYSALFWLFNVVLFKVGMKDRIPVLIKGVGSGSVEIEQKLVDAEGSSDSIISNTTNLQEEFQQEYPESAVSQASSSEFILRPDLAIYGVISDDEMIDTLNIGAKETWASETEYPVVYFTGNQGDPAAERNLQGIISLNCTDDYPPLRKTFLIWKYQYENHLNYYKYFIQVDSDSYVNAKLMDGLIAQLEQNNRSEEDLYIGIPGRGRSKERKELGLEGPYCLGPGYIISRSLLAKFGPYIEDCINDAKTTHSDTEIGRCIYRYAKVSCTEPAQPFIQIYYQRKGTNIIGRKLSVNQQMVMAFPEIPTTDIFDAAVIHPLKHRLYFNKLHEQVKYYLRQPQPPALISSGDISQHLYEQVRTQIMRSCVNNPSTQLMLYPGYYAKECPSPAPERNDINAMDIPVFVLEMLKLSGDAEKVKQMFDQVGFSSVSVFASEQTDLPTSGGGSPLKPIQHLYRITMEKLVRHAITNNLERMIVLHADIAPHKKFTALYKQLTEQNRCGGHIFSKNEGGIIILGSTVQGEGKYPKWGKGIGYKNIAGWGLIRADMKNHTHSTNCFNANAKSKGSFAVMYHRSTFPMILRWLAETNEAFDGVFDALSKRGKIVRVAFPFLVMPGLDHLVGLSPKTRLPNSLAANAKKWRYDVNDFVIA